MCTPEHSRKVCEPFLFLSLVDLQIKMDPVVYYLLFHVVYFILHYFDKEMVKQRGSLSV